MSENTAICPADDVIRTIRNRKVILDADLARIYGVPTKRLNEQVRRNADRFPDDFAFQPTPEEVAYLRSQIATSSCRYNAEREKVSHPAQLDTHATHGGRRYRPYAFTEHGAIMAATVLNSPKAVEMSVFVVRAFVRMREQLLTTAALAARLAEVEKTLLTHDATLRDLYRKIRPLLLPPPDPPRKGIGFGVKERQARYRVAKKPRP